MKIGYTRTSLAMDQLSKLMQELERAGCERVVVDNATNANDRDATLQALFGRLEAGDTLTVTTISCLADSLPKLIERVLALDERGVRLQSLAEGFDTAGKQHAGFRSVFKHLQEFQSFLASNPPQMRRAGRPKSLSIDAVKEARELLRQGHSIDEVTQRLRVSRSTLYRYLELDTN